MPGTIGFLIFDDVEELDLVGPYTVLSIWGKKCNGPERRVIIKQELGAFKGVHGLQMMSTHDFSNCPPLDYLVVPGGQGQLTEVKNEKLIEFIRDASKNCKAILSICTGAFLLQAAGLLDGKKATTHWALLNKLRTFDKTTVIEDRFVKDGNIWTSSGVIAGVDLALAFIADISGDKVAGAVQAYMENYPLLKFYGDFHNSKEAPQYLKRIQQGNGGNSSNFFQSKQNIKGKFKTSSDISNQTPPKKSTLRAKL